MRSGVRHSSRGFSLAEMITVVAIIGLLSMIAVPAFMNFRNSNTLKSAMGSFITDVRYARQYAITHSVEVRVDLAPPGNPSTSTFYRFYNSPDNGVTWNQLTFPGANGNYKTLSKPVWFDSTASIPLSGTTPQIVYNPNGSVTLASGATTGQVIIGSPWTRMTYDRYTIVLSPSGQMTSTGSHS